MPPSTETIADAPPDTIEPATPAPALHPDENAPELSVPVLDGGVSLPADPFPRAAPVRKRRYVLGPMLLLAIAVESFVGAGLMASRDHIDAFAVLVVVGLTAAGLGLARGLIVMILDRGLTALEALVTLLASVGNLAIVLQVISTLDQLWVIRSGRRGRQLRSFGRVLLPPVVEGPSWSRAQVEVADAGPSARELASQWRENGRTEHASVAAFARLTLDLVAVGAPPGLVAAASRDAQDEIRHTELCFSVARALDGSSEGPGPFPDVRRARTPWRSRPLALAQLAADSLVDGAFHEGVSARVIAKLTTRCEDPAIRATLRELASDEARHAADGWDVVAWCLQEGGLPVAEALRSAARRIPRSLPALMPVEARDGSWERWGIHGERLEREAYEAARARIVHRVEQLTRAASAPACRA